MTSTLSHAERPVFETIAAVDTIGLHVLEHLLESRQPADETEIVVTALARRGLVRLYTGARHRMVSLSSAGRRMAKELGY